MHLCKLPLSKAAFAIVILAALTIGSTDGAIAAPPPLAVDAAATIALDAGHGGRDHGVRGSDGTFEKDICLALAQQLANLLEPAYRVVLIRSADYAVELPIRTGIANQHKADLFVSIHMAASYQLATTGINIYTYQPADSPPARAAKPPNVGKGESDRWDRIQLKYAAASRVLASHLAHAVENVPGTPPVSVQQAPLVVLQGASMPAILIEAGYLTNPDTVKSFSESNGQDPYLQAIVRGIDTFLASRNETRR